MILVGIALADLSVVAFILKPSDTSCYLSIYGFAISVAIIYAPMLVKTNRIYRIFTAGKMGNKRPKLISNKFQLFATSVLISVQVSRK